ncbi:MAG: helix-turn-helix transcriptional regulator [Clostridia bacterium]|nr:helix-turn-helix transcriptional regulator [Clostridia bacterium]
MRKFAERLKELRAESGLSIMALGKAIGVSDATICRWENGVSDIKSDELVKLAEYFLVSTDDLLGFEGRFSQ